VKLGQISGSLVLAFALLELGFRAVLDLLEDFLGIFAKIDVKG
jgi:hypothetical protein